MRNLIVLAAYWNEKEWLEASLQQILKLDPQEIIISDGSFDPEFPVCSEDGTHELLQAFVRDQGSRARLITPVRVNAGDRGLKIFQHCSCRDKVRLTPGRVKISLISQWKMHVYRVNQALTFARMAQMAVTWQAGSWVMTTDADQFYTDSLIDCFDLLNDRDAPYELITADEYTFPESFTRFTTAYESRKWNNMPIRIKQHMAYYPTRHLMVENMTGSRHAHEVASSYHGGVYHHYKFRENAQRNLDTYKVGDRKPPEAHRFHDLQSAANLDFPEVIRQYKQFAEGVSFPCPVQ